MTYSIQKNKLKKSAEQIEKNIAEVEAMEADKFKEFSLTQSKKIVKFELLDNFDVMTSIASSVGEYLG
jgi:t-SNARE complex subunit (syntaxin)